ncbi:VOC family protein [Pseudanabaena sp. UWO311]|uniref:VOC family protein n=1 Tax=Pseudanabaena sp. UWO311 TaxID=2487337 RepID=UPI001156D486|nr:VOC family protein [Pseudanabaena sp. UWO311]TYQ23753.1 VOC family protein [Pseudanabaena sp. UWO311]
MAIKFQKRVFLIAFSLVLGVFAQEAAILKPLSARSPYANTWAIAQAQPVTLTAVDSVGITVSDMDKAIQFYSEVLSFQKISDVEVLGSEYERLQGLFGVHLRVVKMRLGGEILELTEFLTPKGRPIPVDSRSNDRWFQHIAIAVSDMDKAYETLRKFKVQHASTAPQRIPDTNKAAAGIRAFYFKDPDGHNLEIIYFPKGKGDPKWQENSQSVFLGIDHTAIVVSNTDASLKFYRDVLGLKLAGESENFGTEQEHLNNVFGAKLRISGLKAPSGLGIEFLDYLSPSDGKPYPSDARTNDLLYWQTTLVVNDAKAIAQKLRSSRTIFISPDVIEIPSRSFGFKSGFLVRDPDGHALRIIEK